MAEKSMAFFCCFDPFGADSELEEFCRILEIGGGRKEIEEEVDGRTDRGRKESGEV
jgi:hypothetical protein